MTVVELHTEASPSGRRPRRLNWWVEFIVEAFYCATEAWLLRAEAVALGYETELREYAAENPRPTLKGFMLANAGMGRRRDQDDIDLESEAA